MSSKNQPLTCGQGLAQNAVLPAAIGRVLSSIADVLAAHATTLVADDAAAAKEHAAYAELIERHRRIAAELAGLAERMEHQRDLPMAAHDSAMMSAPAAIGAFETSVKLERELAELIGKRVEQHQKMLVEWLSLTAVDETRP
jgi:serine/threonine protein kinase HipA of HipAB toxin-antitoxin module